MFSKKSSISLVSLLAVVVFTGCGSHHSDNAGTPSSTLDVNANLPFQGQTATAQQIADMNRVCEGGHHHPFHRDGQIRQNDSELREIKISNGGQLTITTLKNTYLGAEGEDSHISTKILSVMNSENGEYLKSPFEYSSICKSQDDVNERSCDTDTDEAQITKVMKAHMTVPSAVVNRDRGPAMNCMMGTNEKTSVSFQVGAYTLRDRRTVSALREIKQTTGIIMCNGRYAGHGTMTMDEVYSTQVASVGQLVGCKGSEIYSGHTFRLDNGMVLSSSNSATISGPTIGVR